MSASGTTRIAGIRVLDPPARAAAETAATGRGLRRWWASYRLWQDNARRNTATRREVTTTHDGFVRPQAALTDRGYRGLGGGRASVVPRTPEWRSTTTQVSGLWPWVVGAVAPTVGTPVGHHWVTGEPVHFDPMSWFLAGHITAPSMFVLALNGFGKSSLIRRLVTGAVAAGDTAMCLGDTKPDYRDLVETLGGQVIDLGYGHGKLNPLAVGALGAIVDRLPGPAMRRQVAARVLAGQVTVVAALIELMRGGRVADFEETLLAAALRHLYGQGGFTPERPPLLEDLLATVSDGGAQMMQFAEEDSIEAYRHAAKPLRRSLRALVEGPFGEVFNGHTTVVLDPATPAVCVDVSHIPEGDTKLLAAVLLVCWSDGFGAIHAAHTLADAGLAPKRVFHVIMDEIWRVLGVGDFMVDRIDALTRLNRTLATSLIMCSHTIKDLGAFDSRASMNKALGFLERARAKIIGPVGPDEVERLRTVLSFTATEAILVNSWAAPRAPTDNTTRNSASRFETPAGAGCFLLKTGEDSSPGIPFRMTFTPTERRSGIHNTNKRFDGLGETT